MHTYLNSEGLPIHLFVCFIDMCQRLRGRKNWVCPGGVPPPAPTYALPYPMVASFGLRDRDIQDILACIMSDADGFIKMSLRKEVPH